MNENKTPTIRFALMADGGFAAGDTKTGRTAYAYPTSQSAEEARKNPAKVAAEMLASELAMTPLFGGLAEYDERNWGRIYTGAHEGQKALQPTGKGWTISGFFITEVA